MKLKTLLSALLLAVWLSSSCYGSDGEIVLTLEEWMTLKTEFQNLKNSNEEKMELLRTYETQQSATETQLKELTKLLNESTKEIRRDKIKIGVSAFVVGFVTGSILYYLNK